MENEKDKETEQLKHFDSIFDTDTLKHINFSNMPLLEQLFNYFEEDLYRPSAKYEKLRKKQIAIADSLESTFTENQKTLFEKYWEITNQMDIEENRQLFCFGYIIAKKLEQESKIDNKETNK